MVHLTSFFRSIGRILQEGPHIQVCTAGCKQHVRDDEIGCSCAILHRSGWTLQAQLACEYPLGPFLKFMIIFQLYLLNFCPCCWQARSKTDAARTKAAQEAFKELQNARQEALQRKKAEKKKLMEEADAKLSAEALRKKEEKERARQMKKSGPKVKMLRS